jgi:hypothetical protein
MKFMDESAADLKRLFFWALIIMLSIGVIAYVVTLVRGESSVPILGG